MIFTKLWRTKKRQRSNYKDDLYQQGRKAYENLNLTLCMSKVQDLSTREVTLFDYLKRRHAGGQVEDFARSTGGLWKSLVLSEYS